MGCLAPRYERFNERQVCRSASSWKMEETRTLKAGKSVAFDWNENPRAFSIIFHGFIDICPQRDVCSDR
jgi:hypothetical protein